MTKGNGKDEAQQPEEQPEEQQEQLAIMGIIVIDPNDGVMRLRVNDNVVQDRVKFFHAVTQLGLGSAIDEYNKQQASKILRPKRQVARL